MDVSQVFAHTLNCALSPGVERISRSLRPLGLASALLLRCSGCAGRRRLTAADGVDLVLTVLALSLALRRTGARLTSCIRCCNRRQGGRLRSARAGRAVTEAVAVCRLHQLLLFLVELVQELLEVRIADVDEQRMLVVLLLQLLQIAVAGRVAVGLDCAAGVHR